MSETIEAPTEAPEAPETIVPETPAPDAVTPPETAPAPDKDPEPTDPVDKRIAREVRAKHEARREAVRLSEEVARLTELVNRTAKPADTEEAPARLTEAEIDRRAAAKAAEMSERREFDAACDRVFDAGVKAHADFQESVGNLNGALGDLIVKRPDFLNGIAALPNGHEVYYKLAQDIGDAERVLRLSPVKLGIELAKRSAAASAPKAISRAPAPMESPSGGTEAVTDLQDPKMPIDKWAAKFRETYNKGRR